MTTCRWFTAHFTIVFLPGVFHSLTLLSARMCRMPSGYTYKSVREDLTSHLTITQNDPHTWHTWNHTTEALLILNVHALPHQFRKVPSPFVDDKDEKSSDGEWPTERKCYASNFPNCLVSKKLKGINSQYPFFMLLKHQTLSEVFWKVRMKKHEFKHTTQQYDGQRTAMACWRLQ